MLLRQRRYFLSENFDYKKELKVLINGIDVNMSFDRIFKKYELFKNRITGWSPLEFFELKEGSFYDLSCNQISFFQEKEKINVKLVEVPLIVWDDIKCEDDFYLIFVENFKQKEELKIEEEKIEIPKEEPIIETKKEEIFNNENYLEELNFLTEKGYKEIPNGNLKFIYKEGVDEENFLIKIISNEEFKQLKFISNLDEKEKLLAGKFLDIDKVEKVFSIDLTNNLLLIK